MPEITSPSTNSLGEGSPSLEKHALSINEAIDEKNAGVKSIVNTNTAQFSSASSKDRNDDSDANSDDVIIITGADAAAHLLPLRDDGDSALTFRSLFLASCLSCFQAVMYQIYTVSASKLIQLPERIDVL